MSAWLCIRFFPRGDLQTDTIKKKSANWRIFDLSYQRYRSLPIVDNTIPVLERAEPLVQTWRTNGIALNLVTHIGSVPCAYATGRTTCRRVIYIGTKYQCSPTVVYSKREIVASYTVTANPEAIVHLVTIWCERCRSIECELVLNGYVTDCGIAAIEI